MSGVHPRRHRLNLGLDFARTADELGALQKDVAGILANRAPAVRPRREALAVAILAVEVHADRPQIFSEVVTHWVAVVRGVEKIVEPDVRVGAVGHGEDQAREAQLRVIPLQHCHNAVEDLRVSSGAEEARLRVVP